MQKKEALFSDFHTNASEHGNGTVHQITPPQDDIIVKCTILNSRTVLEDCPKNDDRIKPCENHKLGLTFSIKNMEAPFSDFQPVSSEHAIGTVHSFTPRQGDIILRCTISSSSTVLELCSKNDDQMSTGENQKMELPFSIQRMEAAFSDSQPGSFEHGIRTVHELTP